MSRWIGAYGGLVLGFVLVASVSASGLDWHRPPTSLRDLRQRLAADVSQPRFRHARWGIEIGSLDSDLVLFADHAEQFMVPASNTKLFSTSLALTRLGPDFRFRTSVYATTAPDRDGTLRGDLILFGRGDPTLGSWPESDPAAALVPLAKAVAAAGVRRIQGDVVGDTSYFRGSPFGTGWEWDDLVYGYGAATSALTFHLNSVELIVTPGAKVGDATSAHLWPEGSPLGVDNWSRTVGADSEANIALARLPGLARLRVAGSLPAGHAPYRQSVSVPQPAQWCVQAFATALRRWGITWTGRVRIVDAAERRRHPLVGKSLRELAHLESPPLREIIPQILKPSQNLEAQLLLLQMGALAQVRDPALATRTTEAVGLRELQEFLKTVGIAPGDVSLAEGAGLTRRDLVTAAATVRLLQYMSQTSNAAVFYNALPIAGVDGTLRERFKGTPAADNAHAKTGTLKHDHALSGYVRTAAGERLVFALFLNDYVPPAGAPRATRELDNIVSLLATIPWRTGSAVPSRPPAHGASAR